MKKRRIIVYIFMGVVLTLSIFICTNKDVIFQCGNPIPYISKILLLNDNNSYLLVSNDNSTYITKKNDYDDLFLFIEDEYNVKFKEQFGSGFLFESDTTKIILASQIYWRYYMVWNLNIT